MVPQINKRPKQAASVFCFWRRPAKRRRTAPGCTQSCCEAQQICGVHTLPPSQNIMTIIIYIYRPFFVKPHTRVKFSCLKGCAGALSLEPMLRRSLTDSPCHAPNSTGKSNQSVFLYRAELFLLLKLTKSETDVKIFLVII